MNIFIKLSVIISLLLCACLGFTFDNVTQEESMDSATSKLLSADLSTETNTIWQKPPLLHFYSLQGIPSLNLLLAIKHKLPELPLYLYREYNQGGYVYHIFGESYNINSDLQQFKKIATETYIWHWSKYETTDIYETVTQFINIINLINNYQSINKNDAFVSANVLSNKQKQKQIKPNLLQKTKILKSKMHFYSNPIFSLPQKSLTFYKNKYKIKPKQYEIELKEDDQQNKNINLAKNIDGIFYASFTADAIKHVDYTGVETLGFVSYNISNTNLLTSQIGFFYCTDKSQSITNINMNFGYRSNLGNWAYGFSGCYEFSLPHKFHRCSLGGEIFYKYCHLSANLYWTISDWKPLKSNNKQYKIKPSNSADASLKFNLPMYTPVSFNLHCKLDLGEEFILETTQYNKNNVFRINASVEYSPIDLIKIYTGCGYANNKTGIIYFAGIKISWGVTVSLTDQISLNASNVYKSVNYNMKSCNIIRNPYIRLQQILTK